MKKITVLAFGICMLLSAKGLQAQDLRLGPDSILTYKNASIYAELYKQGNLREALPAWRYVFLNAPAYQLNVYIRGEDIIESMLKETNKPEYFDTLMMVYDQRMKYFGNEGFVLGRKGIALLNYGDDSLETKKTAYNYLMQSLEMKGVDSHPAVVIRLMALACELANENQLSPETIIDLYGKLSDIAKVRIDMNDKGSASFERCKGDLDAIFFASGLASCETLNGLLTAKYEANKDNLDELKNIASLLRRRECTDLPLYTTLSEAIYRLEPSGDAAYGLALMFIAKKDNDKAEVYLKEAVGKAGDNEKLKEDANMVLAQLYLAKRNYSQAKKVALEVLKINPNSGKAYIIIGRAYASGNEGYSDDEFERRLVFWAAVDKFVKAKQVDPSVAEDATKLINIYSQQFPGHDEAFFNGIKLGQTVHIGSWINEDTSARFRE